MNVDIVKTESDFFDKIDMKRLILSLLTMAFILIEFFNYDKGGQVASWGTIHNIIISFYFFSFSVTNVSLFFQLSLLGNFIILLTSFNFMDSFRDTLINNKILQTIGVFLFLVAILSLFNFLVFEPFVFMYLCFVSLIYYYLTLGVTIPFTHITINTPFFSQPGYHGWIFSFQPGSYNTIWNVNTQNFLLNYFTNGTMDILLPLLILLFIFQFAYLYTDVGKLIPDHYVKISNDFFKKHKYVKDTTNNRYLMAAFFVLLQYSLLFLYILNFSTLQFGFASASKPLWLVLHNYTEFILPLFLFLFFIPYYKRKLMRTELIKINSLLGVKIYDIYLLNFIFMLYLSTFSIFHQTFDFVFFNISLGGGYSFVFRYAGSIFGTLEGSFSYIILFIVALWIATKIIDVYSTFHDEETLHSSGNLSSITPNSFVNSFYVFLLIMYVSAWMLSKEESFYFSLFFFTTLLLVAPFIIRNFFNSAVIKYSIRRLFLIIPMFIGISIIIFWVMSLAGNPIQFLVQGQTCKHDPGCVQRRMNYLNALYGLDKPLYIQWFNWFFHFMLGDMGQQISSSGPVTLQVMAKIIPTLEISLIPTVFAVLISIPLGIMASKKQNSLTDTAILIFVSIGIAVPIFFFIIVLVILFALDAQILPSSGRLTSTAGTYSLNGIGYAYAQWFTKGFPLNFNLTLNGTTYFSFKSTIYFNKFFDLTHWDWLFHMVIPVVCITILGLALYTRLIRAGMLEVMRNDYILSARASGFSEKTIINKYALRNVFLPVLTVLGLTLGTVLSGAPITETVLNWPGLGKYTITTLNNFDYNAIMAVSMVVAIMILFANLFTDILYSVIDPRIRLE